MKWQKLDLSTFMKHQKKKKYRKTHGTITIKTVVNIALKYSDSQEVGIKQEQPEPYGCPRLPPGEGV